MKYYYIHPFKKQYFFPKGFERHDIFLNFYVPYTIIGKISWLLFSKCSLYRSLFSTHKLDLFLPEDNIRNIIGLSSTVAYNLGSLGLEQKITALGVAKHTKFFIKYGQTRHARFNVTNEYNILKQIDCLGIAPKVLAFYSDDNQVLLKTNVFEGTRLSDRKIDKSIIDILILLSKQEINCTKTISSNLLTTFSHGDFCPWNMMSNNSEILLFDWEMAGTYTLGYDFFTYIFQTRFLLTSKISIKNIIDENIGAIKYYFSHFDITDWLSYLKAFTDHKISLEQLKVDKGLLNQYIKLLDYIKEA